MASLCCFYTVAHRVQDELNTTLWKVLKYLANSQYVFPHNFHAFEPFNKAIKGCMFMADGGVQKVGVQ
jgi:hypothetical protein